jgi:hypothetical protein
MSSESENPKQPGSAATTEEMKEVGFGLKPAQIEDLLVMSIATTGGIDAQYMLREKKKMVLSVIDHALISYFNNKEIFQAVKLNVHMISHEDAYKRMMANMTDTQKRDAGLIVLEARHLRKHFPTPSIPDDEEE